uniref:CD96 molecule n=1 Tax=Cyanoderma ruficeps TaxID=181631 RepID=A0A8C3X9S4_9PASS
MEWIKWGATSQTADVITLTEVVHALPGTDVTLVCMFPKLNATRIVQTQWSKTDGSLSTKIAVYHPTYGTHYFQFSEAPYNFSVSFSTRRCCSGDDTGGQYECTFATYPYGTKAARIQLTVKAEEERHYLKKVQLKQTLEIPCLEDTTSANLSIYPLKWLVGENGREEELVTKEPSCPAVYRNSSMLLGQRVLLGLNNTLKVFPTKITDDGRVFSCHVVYHPERVQKSSTTVRVFGKGLMPTVCCLALGKTPLASLTEQPGEISVVQEDLQDGEGFYELRSTLMLQGTHETHKTFSCVCLFPSPGNETKNISSEEIFVSFGRFFIAMTHLKMLRTPNTRILLGTSPTVATTCSSAGFSSTAYSSGNIASEGREINHYFFLKNDSFRPICSFLEMYSYRKVLCVSLTGDGRNTKASRFPWPTAVAVLLLFCSTLVALGIRKWCQYQKEIANPPPPVNISQLSFMLLYEVVHFLSSISV